MKLIVGLGNPEPRYDGTRHNVGFAVLDTFAAGKATFSAQAKLKAMVATLTQDDEKVLLIKPTTYYNETGQAVRAVMDFYKLAVTDLLVIHDELMLPLGKLRIRHSGSDAGNNGLKSIHAHIGDGFARLRIGIATEQRQLMDDVQFVLGKFNRAEHTVMTDFILPHSHHCIRQFSAGQLVDESLTRPGS